MTLVVDANVAIKWFLPQPGEEVAQELLAGNEPLVAPALIRTEVAGAILAYFRDGKITENQAHSAIAGWGTMLAHSIVRQTPDADLYDAAVALSVVCRQPLAACFYLATAQLHNAPLITADPALHGLDKLAGTKINFLTAIPAAKTHHVNGASL